MIDNSKIASLRIVQAVEITESPFIRIRQTASLPRCILGADLRVFEIYFQGNSGFISWMSVHGGCNFIPDKSHATHLNPKFPTRNISSSILFLRHSAHWMFKGFLKLEFFPTVKSKNLVLKFYLKVQRCRSSAGPASLTCDGLLRLPVCPLKSSRFEPVWMLTLHLPLHPSWSPRHRLSFRSGYPVFFISKSTLAISIFPYFQHWLGSSEFAGYCRHA